MQIDIPSASKYSFMACSEPLCTDIHLLSFDDYGTPIMNTSIPANDIPAVIEQLRDYLYSLSALDNGEDSKA